MGQKATGAQIQQFSLPSSYSAKVQAYELSRNSNVGLLGQDVHSFHPFSHLTDKALSNRHNSSEKAHRDD